MKKRDNDICFGCQTMILSFIVVFAIWGIYKAAYSVGYDVGRLAGRGEARSENVYSQKWMDYSVLSWADR